MGADILGSIYERFLGKIIRMTSARRAKVEEKPEVRKAGGVYYTPQYIVDYIVKHTIGAKLEGATPKTLGVFRVIDPACGSGSFLINAYQYLLDWYLREYIKAPADGYKKRLLKIGDNDYKLTIQERKRILTAHIYGVDIDAQAVEVTKLSLLLKTVEGLSDQEIQKNLFKERVLPNLSGNIKCGNSLIGSDFYAQGTLEFSEDEQYKINAFDWEMEFADAFQDGGFSVVIGNPPYGAELNVKERAYLGSKFHAGNTDTAALFMLMAKELLDNDGINGFIIPKAFTYAANWKKTRDKLLQDIYIIADCGKVWSEVKLEMSVYISLKNSNDKQLIYYKRIGEDIKYFGKKEKKLCAEFDLILNGVTQKEINIGIKLKRNNKTLNDFVTNQRGGMLQNAVQENGDMKVLGGKQIKRYAISESIKGKIDKEDIALCEKCFVKENAVLAQNIVAHIEKPYPHIQIAVLPSLSVDANQYIILDTINQLECTEELSSYFVCALLNSKLISWYMYRFIFANAIRTMHFDSITTSKIPIPALDISQKSDKAKHDRLVAFVDQMLALKKREQSATVPQTKTMLGRQITALDKQIDETVYELYGLSKDEISIVENK
jgi:predicted RNA methylase